MPTAGDRCTTVVPVTQEFLESLDAAEQQVHRVAAEALGRACEPHGLIAVDQRMTWHGTVTDARLSGKADLTRDLPDDLLIYCFTATAAQPA